MLAIIYKCKTLLSCTRFWNHANILTSKAHKCNHEQWGSDLLKNIIRGERSMKGRKLEILGIVGVLVLIVGMYAFLSKKHGKYDDVEFSLNDLKRDQEFQFRGLNWGSSYEELKETFLYTLVEDDAKAAAPKEYDFYICKHLFVLDGEKAAPELEFYNDELNIVRLAFKLDDEYQEWYEKQVKQLIELYGDASRRTESKIGQARSETLIWETENTMLQLNLHINKDNTASVIFAVGDK